MAQSEEFRREFGRPPCPVCDNREWAGGDGVLHLPMTDVDAPNIVPLIDDSMPKAVAFICTRCGYIRIHDRRYLDD